MRVLALDLGTVRIGVAVSDPTGTLATPYEVLARSSDPARDRQRIRALVDETRAERVIVGLPLSLDGTAGPAAVAAAAEAEALAATLAVPVETFDERLTTVTAHQRLAEQGVNAKGRRKIVDKAAAAVLLQAWLEGPARRAADGSNEPPDGPMA